MTAQPALAEVDAPARRSLLGLTRDELREVVTAHGGKPFHAKVLFHWLYYRGAVAFDDMTSLPKGLRAALAEGWTAERPAKAQDLASADGTHKWLLRFADGNEAESVHIPDGERGTLCVSSQVGCTLSCRFCHTGTQRLVRNLGAGEIVAQVLVARDHFGEWPAPSEDRQLTNIVMMGMGEPLYNYDNVAKALRIVLDPEGLALGKRRITLSTAGVVPMIHRCGEELGVNLAISLHAVTDELRDEIVPLNRKYPIAELLDACRNYPTLNNARRITFEYVMLDGVNDSPADARELARLVRDIPSKINLIPFNPWPGAPYACSSDAAIARFADILADRHLTATIRTPRGRDIMAACGQLKSESRKLRASQRAGA